MTIDKFQRWRLTFDLSAKVARIGVLPNQYKRKQVTIFTLNQQNIYMSFSSGAIKHVLWVLKKTISMSPSCWAPKTIVNTAW